MEKAKTKMEEFFVVDENGMPVFSVEETTSVYAMDETENKGSLTAEQEDIMLEQGRERDYEAREGLHDEELAEELK
jgi:hypothetical protein